MKRTLIFLVIGIMIISTPSFGEVIGNTDKEVLTIANPILDNILKDINTNDYDEFSQDFDETMKEILTTDEFPKRIKQINDLIGSYKSRTYLGFLNKGNMTVTLWKGIFDKTQDDVLIRLVLSKRNGKYLVTGLWFQ